MSPKIEGKGGVLYTRMMEIIVRVCVVTCARGREKVERERRGDESESIFRALHAREGMR